VLDLAAGSGAMSLRLADLGYGVTATDYVPENFRLHGSIPFFRANLNTDFSAQHLGHFDAVMASEIIEHLENPRHFARECFRLLRPGGRLLLSTPNINSAASIVSFMRTGTFQWFGDAEYGSDGHITPLCHWQLEKCFSKAGFTRLFATSFGDPNGKLRGSPRLLVLRTLIQQLSGLDENLRGQILVTVQQKMARTG
jgi:SAM-dependent methyltransferase